MRSEGAIEASELRGLSRRERERSRTKDKRILSISISRKAELEDTAFRKNNSVYKNCEKEKLPAGDFSSPQFLR